MLRSKTTLVIIWLIIGALAAAQRNEFNDVPPGSDCSQAATITATIVAGPLNYLGLDPRIGCTLPQPSK